VVTLTVNLSDETARRLEEAAQARGVSPEQMAVEAIEDRLGKPRTSRPAPSFIGIGASGQHDGTSAAERHKEIRRAHFADKTASDV